MIWYIDVSKVLQETTNTVKLETCCSGQLYILTVMTQNNPINQKCSRQQRHKYFKWVHDMTKHLSLCAFVRNLCYLHVFHMLSFTSGYTVTVWPLPLERLRNRLRCMLMLLFVCSRLPREATRISSETKRAFTFPKINHARYRVSAFCADPRP